MEVQLLGEIGVELTPSDRTPEPAEELSHGLCGVEHFVNREDQTVEFLALDGQLLPA
jgi:hypothetical protein